MKESTNKIVLTRKEIQDARDYLMEEINDFCLVDDGIIDSFAIQFRDVFNTLLKSLEFTENHLNIKREREEQLLWCVSFEVFWDKFEELKNEHNLSDKYVYNFLKLDENFLKELQEKTSMKIGADIAIKIGLLFGFDILNPGSCEGIVEVTFEDWLDEETIKEVEEAINSRKNYFEYLESY